jgi:hypothetical protein
VTAIAAVDAVVVVSSTAAYATSADKVSFIAIAPGLGSVDIVGGWSGTTATPAEVSHSAYYFQPFLPLYEGTILANVNADVVGSRTGWGGITVSDNYGNTETFLNDGFVSWPVLANQPYTFSVSVDNARTLRNSSMAFAGEVTWVVVPEPDVFVIAAVGLGLVWQFVVARTR